MVFWWCLLTLKLSTPRIDLFNENQVQDVPVERSNMWCEDPVVCGKVGFKTSRFHRVFFFEKDKKSWRKVKTKRCRCSVCSVVFLFFLKFEDDSTYISVYIFFKRWNPKKNNWRPLFFSPISPFLWWNIQVGLWKNGWASKLTPNIWGTCPVRHVISVYPPKTNSKCTWKMTVGRLFRFGMAYFQGLC